MEGRPLRIFRDLSLHGQVRQKLLHLDGFRFLWWPRPVERDVLLDAGDLSVDR